MLKRKVLNEQGYEDWTVDRAGILICPHGHRVEDDGSCPEGCVSPIREMGLI